MVGKMKRLTKKGWQKIAIIVMLFSLISINYNVKSGNSTAIKPFFGITILCPESIPERIEWANLIAEKLPLIGIDVELMITNWSEISQRTWGYPGPMPIPTHAEGGFDALFVFSMINGIDVGPLEASNIRDMLTSGKINTKTLVPSNSCLNL